MNETFGTALLVGFGWLLSLCFHEFSHAAIAYLGGDTSVKEKGYLTFNPLKYTDVNLTLILPLIILMLGGVALPGAAVYINNNALRNRGWQSLVAIGGPIANLICLAILAYVFQTHPDASADQWYWPALALLALYQTIAVLLNALPIPPLDGYGFIEPWLPAGVRAAANRFGQYGVLILFGIFWLVRPIAFQFWGLAYAIDHYLGIPLKLVDLASDRFRAGALVLLGFIFLLSFLSRRKSRA